MKVTNPLAAQPLSDAFRMNTPGENALAAYDWNAPSANWQWHMPSSAEIQQGLSTIPNALLMGSVAPGEPYAYRPMNVDLPTAGLTFYHGTKAPISSLHDVDILGRSVPENLVGHGLYLTDNPAVATGYAKGKGSGPPGRVLSGKLGDLKLMDLEAPAHSDLINAMRDAAPDAMPDITKDMTGRELWHAYYDNLQGMGLPRWEASEMLSGVDYNLTNSGWDGFRHEGGGMVGGHGKHNVVVLFEGEKPGATIRDKITDTSFGGSDSANALAQ